MVLCAAFAAACGTMATPDVMLDVGDPANATVYVGNFSWGDLRRIRRANLSPSQWAAMFRVAVVTGAGPASTPVSGRYDIGGDHVRFTPMFPLDPGRAYDVRFEPRAAGVPAIEGIAPKSGRVTVPARPDTAPPTTVSAVYPGGDEVPANLLRMYIEFSAPMGARDGQGYVSVLDAQGTDMPDAVLPLDTALWNPDRTRFTVLFDPGRVKRGILPNRQAGRPLREGQTFTVLVRRAWPDGLARPLAADFRRAYRVGPAIERPLNPSDWRVTPPAAGSRDPLVVEFPWPLDRGLAQRALSVAAGETAVDGTIRIETGERRWMFVPAQPWQPRAHDLVALPSLEDMCGNRIGRAFETLDSADDTQRAPARLPFQPR